MKYCENLLCCILFLMSTICVGQSFISEVPQAEAKLDLLEVNTINKLEQQVLNKSVTLVTIGDISNHLVNNEIKFELPIGKYQFHAITDFVESDGENYIWNGTIVNQNLDNIGTIALFLQEGERFGQITSDIGDFELFQIKKEVQVLIEKDKSKYSNYTCGYDDRLLSLIHI